MAIIYSTKPLRERDEHDFYPTPVELCYAALGLLPFFDFRPRNIVDPGAGDGPWGEAARQTWGNYPRISGVEIRDIPSPQTYDLWYNNKDYLDFNHTHLYDLAMGNPPFRFAEKFLMKSLDLIRPGGYVVFLLRLAFLESATRYETLYKEKNLGITRPNEVHISTRRVSFTGNKKSDNEPYAIYIWQKDSKKDIKLDWLDWSYDE